MPQINYGGVYANIDYDRLYGQKMFREYPKHIPTGTSGQYVVAKTEEEEAKILAKFQIADDNTPPEAPTYVADHQKDILISRAAELGVPINRKWSKDKLAQVVKAAELEIDNLAPETPEAAETPTEELKEKLIVEAKALGIPANKLWGVPRLKQSIADMKAKA